MQAVLEGASTDHTRRDRRSIAAPWPPSYTLNMKPARKPERAVKLTVIQPRSVLNRSGMGGFTLNPYQGCTVGCAYCYVPHMKHKQLEERKWGTYVDVKEGVPELLDKQLGRLRQPTRVFMSTATDPYQPVEERYQITRRILEVFERHPQHSLFILTKQTLVERDADLIARLPRAAVGMSISVIDDRLSDIIEPWAAPTSGRLATIRRLSERGIATYVLWAPAFVPVPMSREFVRDAMTKIAESRTQALSLDSLNYRSRQPAGLPRRLARDGHAPATAAQVELLRQEARRHGLARRLDLVAPESEIAELQPLLPFE
ncbi:MAG TPA: DUF5131 family protein [Blastocatellia bacterium]|nr:DUF5131 family protein [Blastocatellia bacterium]